MAGSILTLCIAAADETSLSVPEAIVNAARVEERSLRRSLYKTIKHLQRMNWQRLRREHTFTTVATEDQSISTPLPADLLRIVPMTVFNRSKTWRVMGPMTPEEWQNYKSSVTAWSYDTFVIRGNAWLMAPVPAASQTIAYEYITSKVGTTSDGSALVSHTAFGADTDLTFFDDELMILGITTHLRQMQGADVSQEFQQFEARAFEMFKADGGRRVLDMSGPHERVPRPPVMPDTLTFT